MSSWFIWLIILFFGLSKLGKLIGGLIQKLKKADLGQIREWQINSQKTNDQREAADTPTSTPSPKYRPSDVNSDVIEGGRLSVTERNTDQPNPTHVDREHSTKENRFGARKIRSKMQEAVVMKEILDRKYD